jgi:hypothetical protein
MMKLTLSLLLLLVGNFEVSAFSTSPAPTKSAVRLYSESPSPETTTEASAEEESTPTASKEAAPAAPRPSTIYIPLSFDEMVKQAASTMEDAVQAGKKRQILRILLPRSKDNENLLQFLETEVDDPNAYVDTVLVPPDETWQGGIMQLYRAASLACQEILRCVSPNNTPSRNPARKTRIARCFFSRI